MDLLAECIIIQDTIGIWCDWANVSNAYPCNLSYKRIMNETQNSIIKHYCSNWFNEPVIRYWDKGPMPKTAEDFCILEFGPTKQRAMWTYATCNMSDFSESYCIDLHLFYPCQDESILELLTAVAYFHRTVGKLDWGHTVYFGRPWLEQSTCDYGLISLPYLDGPNLEYLPIEQNQKTIRFLWLIPITKQEREYKRKFGLDKLEQLFLQKNFNYLNPYRESVIE